MQKGLWNCYGNYATVWFRIGRGGKVLGEEGEELNEMGDGGRPGERAVGEPLFGRDLKVGTANAKPSAG